MTRKPSRSSTPSRTRKTAELALERVEDRLAPATVSNVREATGLTAASILGAVSQFRSDLGTLNANVANSFTSGRREINWDGTPDAKSAPNLLPANFFNTTSPRGVVFSNSSGDQFEVSSNPTTAPAVPVNFGDIDPTYSATFAPFSVPRLFTPVGSNVTNVQFFIPGTTTPATVQGFGAVFSDVDTSGTTKMEFIDRAGNILATRIVPPTAGAGTFSFEGVTFSSADVALVRITTGTAALAAGTTDVTAGGSADLAVMDDFIYGEPVAVTATVPGAQTVATHSVGVASVANGNPVTLAFQNQIGSTPGNTPVQVTLRANNGTLTLADTTGLTFISGTGTGDKVMTLIGSVPNINTALNGLKYTPTGDFVGTDNVTLSLDDFNQTSTVPITVRGEQEYAVGPDAGGSGVVRFFNQDGTEKFSVTPFPGTTGGVRVAVADFNGDGVGDLVVATGPGTLGTVRVLNGKDQTKLFEFTPFADFTGGLFVAAGDVNGDGVPDLIVTPDVSGGPRVRVLSGASLKTDGTFTQIADFFGINDPAFRGGARAAAGDIDGDGKADLIVAAGFGGGPRVAVFSGAKVTAEGATPNLTSAQVETWKPFGDFVAFDTALRNGVYVTAGDIDGDGKADLVFGAGPGGGPEVRVVSGAKFLTAGGPSLITSAADPARIADFFAGDTTNRGGIRVATHDEDSDNKMDLIVGPGVGGGSRVTTYAGKNITGNATPPELRALDMFPGFTGGVFVG